MAAWSGAAAWLRLERSAGVGPAAARRLLGAFGLPEHIFAAGVDALARVVPPAVARSLAAAPDARLQDLVGRTLDWAARPGNHFLTLADAAYPPALLDIPDPPLVLYAQGRVELLSAGGLAIVGSRQASIQGTADAGRFAEALSQAGLTIVSGLARGIDAAAHAGALRGEGSTVAVIGTGIDLVYPAAHRALSATIAGQGCLVSEYPLSTPPASANFPRRNRIISGLARGVLVVEAAPQSGSLITARMAAEQGRDVFAIPGSIHSPMARGCHQLIKQGAKLVETAEDILEELRYPAVARVASLPEDRPADDPLLAALGFDPVAADALALRTGLDAAALAARLLALELDGRVEMLPGGQVRRLA